CGAGGPVEDVRARGVGGVKAAASDALIDVRPLFQQELHGEAFLVLEVHSKADDIPEAVVLPPLLPRIQRVARRGAVADSALKIKVVGDLVAQIGGPKDMHPDVVPDFDKV